MRIRAITAVSILVSTACTTPPPSQPQAAPQIVELAATPEYRTWLDGPVPSDAVLHAAGYVTGDWIIIRFSDGRYQLQKPIACGAAVLALVSDPASADCFVVDDRAMWNGLGAHERRLGK